MNLVLDMQEELMVKVEQHEIAIIIFVCVAVLFLIAIMYLIIFVHDNRQQMRDLKAKIIKGHNKLAERLQTIENTFNY